ncbi:hypothetical protein EJ05DRAFT_213208 [Pseudovirgaria hyperparasitica]|uniref:Uncharacterized protein n=1 Tax=Pseudovirgaria hyperparasitica TaxID=470096 RepID=A0A6A6VUT9_9PEZI|nr:uncharacterized protein EJ05DRAFT_213208 [Pseudovirgaria hyperparasitica]KAF2753380.1 hypothetical protein EJ05DRAFT_213208 [Pseudovirgaria hyperparasitica]
MDRRHSLTGSIKGSYMLALLCLEILIPPFCCLTRETLAPRAMHASNAPLLDAILDAYWIVMLGLSMS